MSKKMSRRQFLRLSAGAAGIAAFSSALPNIAVKAAQMTFSEAPDLAELVAAGELPPVAERLPVNPVVVEPMESVGVYGGSIRTATFQDRGFQVRSTWGPEPILRIGRDSSTIEPNIAESWEYSEDGTSFTVNLREGMKWSDGGPFNADGFEFWHTNVLSNADLPANGANEFRVNGQLPSFTKNSDTSFTLTWDQPHANLPGLLSHWIGVQMTRWLPRHYLEQFHPDFADAAELEAEIADGGFETWEQLISNRVSVNYGLHETNIDMPTVLPFKLSRPKENNLMVADRNPYYWKVDTEGKQLPYVNEVIVNNFENPEGRDAAIAAGELNYVNTDTTFTNFPLYQENAEGGNYVVRLWKTSRAAEHTLMLNHTCQDMVLREIFSDVRFKRALSLAMDRQTIANVVYQGFGVPSQVQMIPGSKYRVEEYVTRDTEYDPDTASALLDEMGLETNDEGMRMRPDGEPLVLRLDIQVGQAGSEEVAELWREFFGDVGIELDIRPIARDLIRGVIDNNEIEVGMWIADKCSDAMFPHTPVWHVPFLPTDWNQWGIEWVKWYATDGSEGEEPPAEVAQVQALFDEMKVTVDEDRRVEIGKEIMRLNIENLWNIGNVGEVPIPVILGSNMINYPADGFTSFDWLGNHQYQIEQVYFDGGEWAGAPA
jgi:peptide/nickel transport system substrate-binding protein